MIPAPQLLQEEMDEVERAIRSDPVQWAYWKLKDPKGNPWKARWYQKKMIKHIMGGGRRVAARMGRRVGKTETMVIFCLWYAFHHKNSRLLICTPYENQVRLIFMRLNELIDGCEELQASIKTRTKNPFIIQFNNGGTIMGFTVGATAGNAGASIRGQRADWLFIDECDYIDQGGIDATTAIALEDPSRIGIWASSTPTGKRGWFYNICNNKDSGYSEFYFPTMVNPDWDEKMEAELRATMTDQGYTHEVLAEFGEETIGVFSKSAVERAYKQFMYSYRQLNVYEREVFARAGYKLDDIVWYGPYTKNKIAPKAIRTIGCDWDKYANATQIVVTEFDELRKKFRVCYRAEIPRGQFTLDNAVQKIVELNEIYDPKFIYVDRGFGEYQLEMLHKIGYSDPSTELHKKVKGIHFGSKIEVVDPGTREVDMKDTKPFMVNQTSILLERDQIILSPFDEMIWQQMMDYQVVKITQNGRPVYTSENEHALDAFMLSILAFTLEMPEITQILEQIQVARKSHFVQQNQEDKLTAKIFDGRDPYKARETKPQPEEKDNPNWHMRKVSSLKYAKDQRNGGSFWGARGSSRTGSGFRRSSF